jgi:eukaryotic-like serine/threonine-protein kinase
MREYALLVATALLLGCGSDSNKVGRDEEEVAGTVTAELADGVTMDFVWIEPGTFTMGAPSSESGRGPDEGPQHEVTISRGFYLGKYELTQAQWEAVVGSNPSAYKGVNQPVETVSWDDVQTFI